jgi:hypothetical protein
MRGATNRGRHSMRLLPASRFALAWILAATPAWILAATPAMAADTLASMPSDLSVTVYRAPTRRSGSITLSALGGFALISETRIVRLPAGLSRLRFEGVADGIEPSTAIVTGLPAGVIEKNREGKLLSPSALVAAAVGKPVTLLRTDKKTGKSARLAGTIRSDAGGGVVFETSEGVEALRCSGLPESLSFMGVADLAATPTLSVQVRSAEPVTRTVTLSYLARDFDWGADYVATVAADGKTMDLGAWVTLANGNGVGFPSAQLQVVAGRVNRESGEVEPLDVGGPILAQCWPRGSTSDLPQYLQIDRVWPLGAARNRAAGAINPMAMAAAGLAEVTATAKKVEQEQLGDLKLYRVPEHTTVASRQSKQMRLLDRSSIPITHVYGADLAGDDDAMSAAAHLLLRTINDAAHHLGLPLPSGRVAVFAARDGATLLDHESNLRDLAVDEEVEVDMGDSPGVQVAAAMEKTTIDPARTHELPLVPGVLHLRSAQVEAVNHVDIGNALGVEIQFELRLRLPEGGRVVRADHPLGSKNGRPIFRLTIPANGTVTVRYQWQHMTG